MHTAHVRALCSCRSAGERATMSASVGLLMIVNIFGPPSECPPSTGWYKEGSFLALDEDRLPWYGTRRGPTSWHSSKYLLQYFGDQIIKPEEAMCAQTGELRCFSFPLQLFDGIFKDAHSRSEPFLCAGQSSHSDCWARGNSGHGTIVTSQPENNIEN